MTSEPKLLDPSAIDAIVDGLGLTQVKRVLLLDFLRRRGLIAQEPVDPLREVVIACCDKAYTASVGGKPPPIDPAFLNAFLAEFRQRGMELRPQLTRERLREALNTYDDPMSCLTSAERGEALADAARAHLCNGENT